MFADGSSRIITTYETEIDAKTAKEIVASGGAVYPTSWPFSPDNQYEICFYLYLFRDGTLATSARDSSGSFTGLGYFDNYPGTFRVVNDNDRTDSMVASGGVVGTVATTTNTDTVLLGNGG
jgi:hypothetical protein